MTGVFAGGGLGTRQNPLASVALHPIIALLGFLLSSYWCFHSHRRPNDCVRASQTNPIPLHADHSPATPYCGPARFLVDLPSLFSAGASSVRQLLLDFHTSETRGYIFGSSFRVLDHGGFENRARSRAALLVTSVAPGASLRRYVACTFTSLCIFLETTYCAYHGL